jgi:hypothetical protein
VLLAVGRLLFALRKLGVAPAAAAAAAADAQGVAQPGAVGDQSEYASSSSSRPGVSNNSSRVSSSSSNQQPKWGHLLQLAEVNAQWSAAVDAFDTKWHGYNWHALTEQLLSSTGTEIETAEQQYQDALQLCR